MENDKLKAIVKEKYGEIAVLNSSCCGGSKKVVDYSMINDEYNGIEGYLPEADLGLGCGLPTGIADIKKGNVVVDLGSGAGNDVFIARSIVGMDGHVTGIDFTETMIQKAKLNNSKLNYSNVDFKLGEIENIPLPDNYADVVISNCVLNLIPDKNKAFNEIFRILKPGGHFCISDIVIKGDLPQGLKNSASMYAGCVAGAIQQEDYLNLIESNNFSNVSVRKTKEVILPDNILSDYLSTAEIAEFKSKNIGIFSITVIGYKY
jgi:arsenite methyltransferase